MRKGHNSWNEIFQFADLILFKYLASMLLVQSSIETSNQFLTLEYVRLSGSDHKKFNSLFHRLL